MTTKIFHALVAACAVGVTAVSARDAVSQTARLHAPGYYIAIDATKEYEGVIRVRGASNLPVGAKIGLTVEGLAPENGLKPFNTLACVAVEQSGLFRAELQIAKDAYQKKDLIVHAIFVTYQCAQDQDVIRAVGRHGELLGNDGRPVTMDEVENGMTRGMTENPQLFQVSGWYFGLGTIARVD
jgi:hypothetical protein